MVLRGPGATRPSGRRSTTRTSATPKDRMSFYSMTVASPTRRSRRQQPIIRGLVEGRGASTKWYDRHLDWKDHLLRGRLLSSTLRARRHYRRKTAEIHSSAEGSYATREGATQPYAFALPLMVQDLSTIEGEGQLPQATVRQEAPTASGLRLSCGSRYATGYTGNFVHRCYAWYGKLMRRAAEERRGLPDRRTATRCHGVR